MKKAESSHPFRHLKLPVFISFVELDLDGPAIDKRDMWVEISKKTKGGTCIMLHLWSSSINKNHLSTKHQMNHIPILIKVHDGRILSVSLESIFHCAYWQSDLEHAKANTGGKGTNKRRSMLNK